MQKRTLYTLLPNGIEPHPPPYQTFGAEPNSGWQRHPQTATVPSPKCIGVLRAPRCTTPLSGREDIKGKCGEFLQKAQQMYVDEKIQSARTFLGVGCPGTDALLLGQNKSSGSLPARNIPRKDGLVSWAWGSNPHKIGGQRDDCPPPLCMVSTCQNFMKHPLHNRTRLHHFGMKQCENLCF